MRKPVLRVAGYRHSKSTPWVIEGYRLPGGKRKRLFFKSEKEALNELEKLKTRLLNEGRAGLLVSDELRAEAAKCAGKLKPFGRTITEAVDYYIDFLRRTVRSCTVSELAETLLAAKKQDGKAHAYLYDLTKRVQRFALEFGGRKVSDIQARELDDWLRALPLSPKSRNNFRANVGVLFSYAVDRGFIERNPIERTGKAKLVDKPPEIFTLEELAALLAHADADILPALAIGAFAGLRHDEIGRLEWSEINLVRGFINVWAAKAKTARRRLVKIEPCLMRWLAPYAGCTGRVVAANERNKTLAARKAAGLTRWPYNGLRHSFASYHVAHFGDAARTAMELGHATAQMLFSTYRELVGPEEAARYWQIMPPSTPENVIGIATAQTA